MSENEQDDLVPPTEELGCSQDAPVEIDGCVLHVSSGNPQDVGRSLRLLHEPVVVGSDPECELVLTDSTVSRRHVRICVEQHSIAVEDLGSTNGTTYLDQRIARANLSLGARLGVGRCTIDLLPLPGSRSLPLSTATEYGGLVGASLPMRHFFAQLELLESSLAPVVIQGATGTGKELVARAIHSHSERADAPLIVVDCAAIPVSLIESQLFGHKRGAFTGAVQDHTGAFEAAHGGSVFLDELNELPLEMQPKLLRVLESKSIKRVGENSYRPADVRVIAAGQRDLAEEVRRGRFREDLYYRIAVVQLSIPSLSERLSDIPMLVERMLSEQNQAEARSLASGAQEFLMNHDWPGNVRELRNAVQRMVALGQPWPPGQTTSAHGKFATTSLAARFTERALEDWPVSFRVVRDRILQEVERIYLTRLWKETEGNLSAAARIAELDRKTLRNLLRKHVLY